MLLSLVIVSPVSAQHDLNTTLEAEASWPAGYVAIVCASNWPPLVECQEGTTSTADNSSLYGGHDLELFRALARASLVASGSWGGLCHFLRGASYRLPCYCSVAIVSCPPPPAAPAPQTLEKREGVDFVFRHV